MTFQTYNNNIPNPPNNPQTDVPNMKVNTNSIAALISQDHFGFNNNAGGNHKQVHLKNTSAPGGLGANADGVFYANLQGGQSWPFWQNNTGIFQLFGQQSIAASGYFTLPGGLIIQWGTASVGSSLVSITFPLAFPTAAFAITALRQQITSTVLGYQNLTQSGVQLIANGASSTASTTWIALGN